MFYQKMLVPARAMMMLSFIMLVMGPLALAIVENHPAFQAIVLKALTLIPHFIVICLLFHIPWSVKAFNELRKRINEDGWYRALMVSHNKKEITPWPRHSDPVAQKTKWGGMETSDDVMRRGTTIKVINPDKAVQVVRTSVLLKAVIQMLLGLIFLLSPFVTSSLVYEVPPAEIVALKQTMSSFRFGFYGIGLFFLLFFVAACRRNERLAELNISTNTINIGTFKLFGLYKIKPDKNSIKNPIPLNEISGLQIISYKSKHTYGGRTSSNGIGSSSGSRKQQYELNLVDYKSQRTTLLKLHNHDALFKDAETLAVFLNVPIWDRSFNYDPATLQHANPLVQSV